jgi:glycerophosphoryl diester phosphodiesterase
MADAGHITRIAAHRGGAELKPENSLAAFANAIALGADMAEFDVHLTRDREIVVIHDATLDRTTSGHGPVAAHSLDELRALTLKGSDNEPVPTFDEVIGLLAPSPLDLRMEIKTDAGGSPYPGFEDMLSARLTAAGLLARTVVTSFDWDRLTTFASLAQPQGLIGLMRPARFEKLGGIVGALQALAEAGLDEIAIRIECLRPDFPARARAAGLRLGAYGVNSAEEIEKALSAGVSAFTTNRPDLALEMRARMAGRTGA